MTDPIRLKQILYNVIGNAIKFTDKGGINVKVREDQRLIGFSVTDSGVGIAPDVVPKLFQPFSQADSSPTREHGGTGLGLALAKRLAQALGGNVELVESALGKGSTLLVTILSTVPEAGRSATRPTTDLKKAGLVPQLRGLKVLLVEDFPDNRNLVSHYLKAAGAVVSFAENGLVALEKAQQEHCDLVLMDLQMPVMDGYEATALLRKQGFRKPIIALTAHALNEEREKCLSLGFDDHIAKPVNRKFLLANLAKYAAL